MRILMFAPGFAPDMASENLVSSKLALAFLRRGWELDVVSRPESGFTYATGWAAPWLPLRRHVHRVEPATTGRAGRLFSALGGMARLRHPVAGLRWAAAAADAGLRLVGERSYDIIISRAPPDAAHLPALVVARETMLPWVANWNDPPLHLWPAPYAVDVPVTTRQLHRRLAEDVAAAASAVTFPSGRLARHVTAGLGAVPAATAVIPHVGLGGAGAAPPPGGGRAFTLCHAGNLSVERDPGNLLRALAQVRRDMEVRLRLVGVGNICGAAMIRRLGLKDVVETCPPVAYAEMREILAASDVLVLIEAACEEGVFLPGKVVDYAEAGRPLLALSPVVGEVPDLLRRYGGGLAADGGSVDAIAAALRQLHAARSGKAPARRYDPGALAAQFQPRAVVAQFEDLFERLGIVACGRDTDKEGKA